MTLEREPTEQLAFEFRCPREQIQGASFVPTPFGAGGVFSCSVGPLPDETIAALDDAVRTHCLVRLVVDDSVLVLDLVTLERRDPHSVRIVGEMAGPSALRREAKQE